MTLTPRRSDRTFDLYLIDNEKYAAHRGEIDARIQGAPERYLRDPLLHRRANVIADALGMSSRDERFRVILRTIVVEEYLDSLGEDLAQDPA